VGALQGDIGQPSGGSDTSNVIALNMTFDYPDPAKAQEVLQSFVQSFLRMDSDVVEDQATLTVRFLQDQALKLQSQIQQIESEITNLKARNGSALVSGGAPSMLDTGSYSAQIVDLENQNRQLLVQARKPARDQAIAAAEAALAAARSLYADSHPDVVAARERLKALRAAIPETDSGENSAVQEQIRANNEAIGALRAQRDAAIAKVNAAVAGQSRAPAILEQASQLEDRASQLREQYKAVADNLLKAQSSARMAGEQRAERLSLIEPANLPDHPHWPNRPLLIGAGALAGLLLGLILALVVELLQRPLRSPVQIEGMGVPVVGIVPIIERGARRPWWQRFRRQEAELA
jgi:protein tyrosine kinase modulator